MNYEYSLVLNKGRVLQDIAVIEGRVPLVGESFSHNNLELIIEFVKSWTEKQEGSEKYKISHIEVIARPFYEMKG